MKNYNDSIFPTIASPHVRIGSRLKLVSAKDGGIRASLSDRTGNVPVKKCTQLPPPSRPRLWVSAVSSCARTTAGLCRSVVLRGVAFACLAAPLSVQAIVGTNLGFETGNFTGWTSIGLAAVDTSNPASGTFHAIINSGGSVSVTPTDTPGLPYQAYNGSAVSTTVTGSAGQVATFQYNFMTAEYTNSGSNFTYNDSAFVVVTKIGTGVVQRAVLASVATDLPGTFDGELRQTGYRTYSYTLPVTGQYSFAFCVVNGGDATYSSALQVDDLLTNNTANGTFPPLVLPPTTQTNSAASVTDAALETFLGLPPGMLDLMISSQDPGLNIDLEPPVVTVSANIAVPEGPGGTGVIVTYPAPTATDNVGVVSLTQIGGLPSGSTFPLGVTTNIFQAVDAAGNTGNASFTVTVGDVLLPLPLDSVALTGSQAPGMAAGVTFNYFGDLSLSASGDMVLYGRVAGPGITAANDAGIWILDGAGFNLMLREGDSVGVAGQTITEPIRHGRITDTGVTHLITGVKGTGVTAANNVIGWVDDGTSTRQYARKGTTFSNLFNGVSEHTATDEGYFAGQLKAVSGSVTAATDTGVWKVNADGTTAVAIREGTVIGGTTKLGNLMNRVAVGSGGFGVYASYLTGVPAANNRAVIKQNFGSAGAPVLVAFSGVANSTTGVANGMFNTFQSESVNASGETAFMAYMKTGVGGVTSADDWGLWRETGGGLQLMLREGQQAPGRPAGAVFHILSQHWLLDDGGMVVLATLRGTNVTSANSTGIWHIDTAGVVSVLLGAGEALPAAVAGGSTVAGFYLRPDVSPAGNYAAVVTLVPGTGDTTSANNLMLLSGNAGTPGVYDLQARRGTIYQVGAGTKTIRNIILGFFTGANGTTTGGSGGMSRIINDGGQVAAWLQFTDGSSGPFISPAL